MLAGAFIAVQAPINSELARGLGLPVAAAAFSFLSGAIVLGIASLAVVTRGQGVALDWRAPAPWMFVAGGVPRRRLCHGVDAPDPAASARPR